MRREVIFAFKKLKTLENPPVPCDVALTEIVTLFSMLEESLFLMFPRYNHNSPMIMLHFLVLDLRWFVALLFQPARYWGQQNQFNFPSYQIGVGLLCRTKRNVKNVLGQVENERNIEVLLVGYHTICLLFWTLMQREDYWRVVETELPLVLWKFGCVLDY